LSRYRAKKQGSFENVRVLNREKGLSRLKMVLSGLNLGCVRFEGNVYWNWRGRTMKNSLSVYFRSYLGDTLI